MDNLDQVEQSAGLKPTIDNRVKALNKVMELTGGTAEADWEKKVKFLAAGPPHEKIRFILALLKPFTTTNKPELQHLKQVATLLSNNFNNLQIWSRIVLRERTRDGGAAYTESDLANLMEGQKELPADIILSLFTHLGAAFMPGQFVDNLGEVQLRHDSKVDYCAIQLPYLPELVIKATVERPDRLDTPMQDYYKKTSFMFHPNAKVTVLTAIPILP